jgi:hypothetical protein
MKRPMKRLMTLAGVALCMSAWTVNAQPTVSNADIVKLSKAGLSEDFILNVIDQQGSRLSSSTSSLIELKNNGVNERIIGAVVRKSPAPEPLNSDSVLSMVRAGFSDGFIINLLTQQPGKFATDASRIIELKEAGVSERLLALMVTQSGGREIPSGEQISIRLIDAIDSDKNNEGDEFRASLEDPLTLGNDVVAPRGADAKVKLTAENESGKLTGKTQLTVQLVSVTVNGKAVPVNSSDVSEYSGSRGERTAKSAGVVGVIGAVIGGIAGGGKGAAIGAASGAAAGAGAQVFMKGQRVKIPSETVLTFTTQSPVKLP